MKSAPKSLLVVIHLLFIIIGLLLSFYNTDIFIDKLAISLLIIVSLNLLRLLQGPN